MSSLGDSVLNGYQTLTQPNRFDAVASQYLMDTPQRFRDNVNAAFPDPRLLKMQTPEGQAAREAASGVALGFVGGIKPEYGITHRPPMKGSGAPLHDLTGGGTVYPDDVYSPMAARYYGHGGGDAMDRQTVNLIQSLKDRPDAEVTMYRAAPKEATGINNGDWVTINKTYAKQHGESTMGGDYKILSQKIPARKLFTNGDSIHEFGYDESGKIIPELLALLAGGAGAGGYLARDK